jgi:hypothetical protein
MLCGNRAATMSWGIKDNWGSAGKPPKAELDVYWADWEVGSFSFESSSPWHQINPKLTNTSLKLVSFQNFSKSMCVWTYACVSMWALPEVTVNVSPCQRACKWQSQDPGGCSISFNPLSHPENIVTSLYRQGSCVSQSFPGWDVCKVLICSWIPS